MGSKESGNFHLQQKLMKTKGTLEPLGASERLEFA